MATSYLDLNGLKHLWEKAEESFSPINTKAEDIYAEGIGDTTVSGNPVVLNDVPYEQDVSSLSVSFEPIQDFNGYDYPWPPGGGENILDPNIKFTTQTVRGITLTTTDGYNFNVSGTGESGSGNLQTNNIPTADCIVYSAGTYTVTGMIIGTYHTDGSWYSNRGGTFTSPEDFIIKNGYREIAIGTTYNVNEFISMTKGTSAMTAWTPYSNICPISGRTEMKVEKRGKNIFSLNESDMGVNWDGNYNAKRCWKTVKVPKGQYTFSIGETNTFSEMLVGVSKYPCPFTSAQWNEGRAAIPREPINSLSPRTVNINDTYIYLVIGFISSGDAITLEQFQNAEFQCELGSTATPYEPYQAETYDITFPTETGTVYGGTLDMLSGVLTVTHGIYTFTGEEEWLRQSGSYVDPNSKYYTKAYLLRGLAKLPVDNTSSVPIVTSIGNFNHAYNSIHAIPYSMCIAADARIGINGYLYNPDGNTLKDVQLCYELGRPITYQLDSHTISLLKGYNFISSDNNIKEITVKYQGESDSTIQNELSEHEEEIRNINQSISSLTSYDIIADGSGETTISGNEINISDAIGGNAISLTANISIRQITEEAETVSCGSGTCVITPLEDPYSSVDIIVKNGINQTKNTVALGTTIGGGNIDIINGLGVKKYICGTYSQFGSKGAASIVDAYYISTLPIDLNLINSCLCNIGTCNPSRILDSNITSPVYGYMEQYPNLFFISFPKSFGISTIELANEFLTQVGGLQIMIPVASPTSFSFTPRNIALFSKNNIITGGRGTELLELTYESSTSSNVQIELNKQNVLLNNIINDIAPVEKSTAIENHSVGDYIILNGKFCKVTTAIATGEIITIGVNVSQTTISAEILAILSQQNS